MAQPSISKLDLLTEPAFTVKDGLITSCNEAANNLFLTPNTDIRSLLQTGKEEYASFESGSLYLTLSVGTSVFEATVHSDEGCHLFILEPPKTSAQLQAMALASQQLRLPLSDMVAAADRLFPSQTLAANESAQKQIAQMMRSLNQMLRLVGNMSDAARYAQSPDTNMVVVDATSVFSEIVEKAAALLTHANITLTYQGPSAPVYLLADAERIERAIYNLISNSAKFSPSGSCIHATLTQSKGLLYFTVTDSGEGLAQQVRANVFNRFGRQPGLTDVRFGVGLGLAIVHATATAHGGTVLLESLPTGTKTTMSLKIRQSSTPMVRSKPLTIDYAGGHDHALIELSDVLPTSAYENLF